MKALITLAIVVVVYLAIQWLVSFYDKSNKGQYQSTPTAPVSTEVRGESLPGLPPSMEASLAAATKEGPAALKDWLKRYRAYVKDPRLAWIELDYVVLTNDPKDAKKVFQTVKERTPPTSPVYDKIKKLEKTYE